MLEYAYYLRNWSRPFGQRFANVFHDFLPGFKLHPVVVELAGGSALKEYALSILTSGRTLICLSSGAFADDAFKQEAIRTAAENNGRICIVNGTIRGLDFLQTCVLQQETGEVVIETTKSPKSLLGAPGLDGLALDLTKRTVVFKGSVQEAIKGFPKNINVGVITALASENLQTKVRIIADPDARSNSHKIFYRSALADAAMEFSGKPDPANPKSSTTAACLKNLYSPISFW